MTLLRETETTAIIVTHDQEEALSVCDVVSVLENGSVIQSATPQEIYLNLLARQLLILLVIQIYLKDFLSMEW